VGNLPTLKPREVVALLEGLGFAEVRQRGSHKQYRHADGRGTTVPFTSGETSLPRCCARLPRTLASPPSSSWGVRRGRSNKRMQLTKLRAAPVLQAEVPPCAPAVRTDGGTASQLIRSVRRTHRSERNGVAGCSLCSAARVSLLSRA
jgi:predicted RNA binding protein YcfA (HicA-like mRNA interferase family)